MLVSKNGIAHLITFKILQSSLFGLAAPCEIDVKIQKVENRKNGSINKPTAKLVVKLVLASEPATAELTTITKSAFLNRLSLSAPRN